MPRVPQDSDNALDLRYAWVHVRLAATQATAGRNNLHYFIRLAASHGLTEDRIADAALLPQDTVHEILDPFGEYAA